MRKPKQQPSEAYQRKWQEAKESYEAMRSKAEVGEVAWAFLPNGTLLVAKHVNEDFETAVARQLLERKMRGRR